MARFLLRRLPGALLTLLGVLMLSFLFLRLIPGDVVTQMIGADSHVSAQRRAELRHLFGLDEPLPIQFARWLGAALHGDLGRSLRTGRPIARDLLGRMPVTAELALLSLGLALALAVPLGVLLAVRRSRPWRALQALGSLGLALPSFWLAILLTLLFSLHLRWLPPAGYVPPSVSLRQNLRHLILPSATLGLLLFCILLRTVRSAVLEGLHRDHVRAARARGLSEVAVLTRHVLRPAALPIITVIGLEGASLLSGAILIEQVFSLPGLGRYALEGIYLRDYPVVQGAVLFIAGLVVVVNLATDLVYGFLDPRTGAGVREGEQP